MADVLRTEVSPVAAAMAEQERLALVMVEAALRAGRVRLAYQPVVVGSAPDRIGFHEGFVRVLDETGRIIPARDFMAAVETTETGRLIDCAALEIGLGTLRQHPGLRLSVNMSARSIGYPKWQRTLKRGLSGGGVGERLILEISEPSAMTVPELVIAFMDDLQSEGVTFALDDFGAGLTSFRHLRDFCFDMIKIDGQFIRGVSVNPDQAALTRALLAVGRHLDMLTVAESVETPADAAFLQSLGIGAMQGYLFGEPTIRPAWAEDAARRRA
jgi:EAL domain-containing protein (putative c-di-GMP-specific phosphodiesterase class I)